MPAYWPGGVRHIGDVSPICCFRVEREKACPDIAVPWGGERETLDRLNPGEIEYRCETRRRTGS
ncbi:hypothetical protein Misp02_71480 [Microtetraspora sp. NBRC 16547]|nr:hypothetical protein Misp02_71480 [Microtetraspora sp. NBRC 16547]